MSLPLLGSGIPEGVVQEHVARLVSLMQANDVDATVIFHPSNLLAFLGTDHGSSDRLSCGVVTNRGDILYFCPGFEAPDVAAQTSVPQMVTWTDGQNAYDVMADTLRQIDIRSGVLALDGRTWLSAFNEIEHACDGFELADGEPLLREVRICKSPLEIDLMRNAHLKGERVYEFLKSQVAAGKTEREVRTAANEHFAPEGLHVFPYVQTGPMGAVPHHLSDDTVMAPGHTVVIDSVVIVNRYYNDLTRTFAIGEPPAKAKQAYQAVRAAQAAGIAAAKPGVACSVVDAAARAVIEEAGFGEYFTHRLGHGLGIEVHEPPYFVAGNDELLRPAMVMTVEPGIYIPGEFGIRIEDDVVITEDGCEVIKGELETDVTGAFDA